MAAKMLDQDATGTEQVVDHHCPRQFEPFWAFVSSKLNMFAPAPALQAILACSCLNLAFTPRFLADCALEQKRLYGSTIGLLEEATGQKKLDPSTTVIPFKHTLPALILTRRPNGMAVAIDKLLQSSCVLGEAGEKKI